MTAPNWANRTMWTGDNLDIMRGMNSESVDLIYLDPPFNSNRNYAAPIGSEAAGAAFKDTWTLDDVDLAWHGQIAEQQPALYAIIDAARLAHSKGMQSYLIMMAVRLLEMRRLLKDTGSIYLHCDPMASHYLKTLMDAVFGVENYRNEIVWCYTGPGSPKMRQFNRKHDTIHWYSKSDTWIFNADTIRLQHHEKTLKNYKEGLSGSGHADTPLRPGKVPESWWAERKGNGLAITARQQKQYVGYPTQKPLALLERIIRASCNVDDVVLDPFCGCATACVAADRLNRQWAGIDLSPLAAKLVRQRMQAEGPLLYDIIHRIDIPIRTDQGHIPPPKTHKHTLFGKQEGHCNGCQIFFPFRNLTIDHIIPRAKGGSDHFDNLQLLCNAFNSTKGAGSQSELIAGLKQKGILT